MKPKIKNFNTFYFVEIENFQTYKQAISLSNILKENGSSSLIFFDSSYHVLVSFYNDENNAKTVAKNLSEEYSNAQVFSLYFDLNFDDKSLTKKQNETLENLFLNTKKILFDLEKISNDFDKNKTSFLRAQLETKKLNENFLETIDDVFSNFKINSKYNTTKNYVLQISTSLNNLVNTEEKNFSKSLRYEIMKIAISLTQISN